MPRPATDISSLGLMRTNNNWNFSLVWLIKVNQYARFYRWCNGWRMLLPPSHDTTLNASNNVRGVIASQVDEIAYLFVIEDVHLVCIFLQ